jgi:hypothetical protein
MLLMTLTTWLHMKTPSLERKDSDISWLRVRLLVKVEFAVFSLGLYSLSVFYIAWVDFQYTNVYSVCALHNYHCGSFTRECHGTAALQAQTMSIYDVLILFSKFICILYIVVTIFWTFFQNNFTRDEATFIVGLVTEASRGLKY